MPRPSGSRAMRRPTSYSAAPIARRICCRRSRKVLSSSGTALKRHTAPHHSEVRPNLAHSLGWNRQQVVAQHDEVAELADLDRAAIFLVEAETRCHARHHPERFLPRYHFGLTHDLAHLRAACRRAVHREERVEWIQ